MLKKLLQVLAITVSSNKFYKMDKINIKKDQFQFLIIEPIDKENEIEFRTLHDTIWITKEEAKGVIEFLQKQITK
jgi:hypothetical protein